MVASFPNPRLLVIVPSFNAARTLGPCLDALLEGSRLPPDEIIVADDASRDGSVAVASVRGSS